MPRRVQPESGLTSPAVSSAGDVLGRLATNKTQRSTWRLSSILVLGLMLLGPCVMLDAGAGDIPSIEPGRLEVKRNDKGTQTGRLALNTLAGVPAVGSASRPTGFEPSLMLGRIEIPRLGLDAIVREGVDLAAIEGAVGHVTASALPGQPGNCALADSRDIFLLGLGDLRENDVIRLITPQRTYFYHVEWSVVVDPRRMEMLESTADRSLTLITDFPFAYVGPAPMRFVVRARQVEGP